MNPRYYKLPLGGPLLVINGVISRVITPVTHLFSAIFSTCWRGPTGCINYQPQGRCQMGMDSMDGMEGALRHRISSKFRRLRCCGRMYGGCQSGWTKSGQLEMVKCTMESWWFLGCVLFRLGCAVLVRFGWLGLLMLVGFWLGWLVGFWLLKVGWFLFLSKAKLGTMKRCDVSHSSKIWQVVIILMFFCRSFIFNTYSKAWSNSLMPKPIGA